MFWNKIPKGYVETVDGYLIKESEAKKVEVREWFGALSEVKWYRKENAPKYDVSENATSFSSYYYRNDVQVSKDGTPVGYHTREEFDLLSNRIAELQARIKELEGMTGYVGELGGVEVYETKIDPIADIARDFMRKHAKQIDDEFIKDLRKNKIKVNKRGRPKKK